MTKTTRKIPDGWREVRLGEVVVLNYGKSLPERKRAPGKIPVYSSAGLTGWHNTPLVNTPGIIIGRKGTIGSIYKSTRPFFPIDTVFYVSENDTSCNLNFLFYLLSNLPLNKLNSDSAVPGLNRDIAYKQKILLPPLSEQKAIAEVLSSLDDKIDLLRRQNQTLESLAQALFRKWFIDNPERKKWEDVKLIKIYEFEKGFEPGSSNYFDSMDIGRVRFIRVGDMLNDRGGVYIDSKLATNMCSTQDLLVSFDGTVGRVNYGVSGGFSSGIRKIYSKIKTYNNLGFKYLLFSSPVIQSQIKKHASGTVILHASSSIKMLSMRLPEQSYVESFNQIITPIFQKTLSNKLQIRTIENLRDTLLPKLMSGEVRVKF